MPMRFQCFVKYLQHMYDKPIKAFQTDSAVKEFAAIKDSGSHQQYTMHSTIFNFQTTECKARLKM